MKKVTSSPAKWSAIHLHNLNCAALLFHLVTSQFTQAHWPPAQTPVLLKWQREQHQGWRRTLQPPSPPLRPRSVALQQVRNNFRTWKQTGQALKKSLQFKRHDLKTRLRPHGKAGCAPGWTQDHPWPSHMGLNLPIMHTGITLRDHQKGTEGSQTILKTEVSAF